MIWTTCSIRPSRRRPSFPSQCSWNTVATVRTILQLRNRPWQHTPTLSSLMISRQVLAPRRPTVSRSAPALTTHWTICSSRMMSVWLIKTWWELKSRLEKSAKGYSIQACSLWLKNPLIIAVMIRTKMQITSLKVAYPVRRRLLSPNLPLSSRKS